MIEKRESALKSQLMLELRSQLRGFVLFRHEDIRKGGVPDISVTGRGKTSWFEVKHATPNFETDGRQELTCLQLAGAGFCRYIIYWENKHGDLRTLILHPKNVAHYSQSEAWATGHNHRFIADYIRQIHGHHN
jgi:hypothetical protein